MSHIEIIDISDSFPERKTKTFKVVSKYDGSLLCHIKWLPQWRCYVSVFSDIAPRDEVYMSSDCEDDVSAFKKTLMQERKKK